MKIRPAVPEDCSSLAVLAIRVWLDTYAAEGITREYAAYVMAQFSRATFLELLNSRHIRILVCERDSVLQGFVLLNLDSFFKCEANGYEVQRLYVDGQFTQQGIGRALLHEAAIMFGGNMWLYTWTENKSNAFYRHLGFEQIGEHHFEFSGQLIRNHVYRACLL